MAYLLVSLYTAAAAAAASLIGLSGRWWDGWIREQRLRIIIIIIYPDPQGSFSSFFFLLQQSRALAVSHFLPISMAGRIGVFTVE